MSITIENDRTISDLCVALLQDCLDGLSGPEALEDEEVVHVIRVATKRLRSAWHLVKELSGPKTAKIRRRALRSLSAHLSSRRDTAVLIELTTQLAAAQNSGEDALLLDRIGQLLRRQPTDSTAQPCPDGLFDEVRESLTDEVAAWNAIDWGTGEARKAIRRTLRRTAAKARQRTRNALEDNSAEVWHDWRKAIKRLRYQREFVAEASGRTLGIFDQRVSCLGSDLGERNDLANLLEFGESMAGAGELGTGELGRLKRIIGITQRDLIASCRRRGRRLLRK